MGNLTHLSQSLQKEAKFQICFRLVLSDYKSYSRGRESYGYKLVLSFFSVICYIIQVLGRLNLKSAPYFFTLFDTLFQERIRYFISRACIILPQAMNQVVSGTKLLHQSLLLIINNSF
jgi:hypothetical protein